MSLIGSPDFHKAVLQTALLASLPITFADRLFQKEFQRLKERKADDDKKFITNGGNNIIPTFTLCFRNGR